MAAMGWTYYAPYQADIQQAFQHVRREVEEAGGYEQVFRQLAEMPAEEYDDDLMASVEGGTGTIYDLLDVEVFPTEVLLAYFGTEHPTRQQAEKTFARGAIWDQIPRDTGYYAVLYDHGIPTEILFAGMTGD